MAAPLAHVSDIAIARILDWTIDVRTWLFLSPLRISASPPAH